MASSAGEIERHTKNIDHFNDVKREMEVMVRKRVYLQRRAGQKLVHCKLKGHEDIANDFKRLIYLKSKGTYYAVKGAQMEPLVQHDRVLPSKSIQERIEGIERDIFSLLSTDNMRPKTENTNMDIGNCVNILVNQYDNLFIKLEQLNRVQNELMGDDSYTDEGFKKRDVELNESLQKKKQDLELELNLIENNKEDAGAILQNDNLKLKEVESNIPILQKLIQKQQATITTMSGKSAEMNDKISESRRERNRILQMVLQQRRSLRSETAQDADDFKLKASQSLNIRKLDLEKQKAEKLTKLGMLKKKAADMEFKEKQLENLKRLNNGKLKQVKEENDKINEKIDGAREKNTTVLRDLETCIEDLSKDMDLDCTLWRDKVIKAIIQAGLLDIESFKNISFTIKSKYQYPLEQFQMSEALKPEIGMLEKGILDIKSKIEALREETMRLEKKNIGISKQRGIKQDEYKMEERQVSRVNNQISKYEELIKCTTKSISDLFDKIAVLAPKANLIGILDDSAKVVLEPILDSIREGHTNNSIAEYNKMKTQILDNPDKFNDELAYDFLLSDWKYQQDIENKLHYQMANMGIENESSV